MGRREFPRKGYDTAGERHPEHQWRQHDEHGGGHDGRHEGREGGRGRGRGRGPGGFGGPGGFAGFGGFGGRQGPPPWVTGLFGLAGDDQRRGPRVKRGDVRSAILDVLRAAAGAEEQLNGYQVINQIAERTGGAWKPSPGSVYPTIQQLQDEGLVESDEGNRRSLRLTAEGTTYAAEHTAELAAVWAPFEERERSESRSDFADLKPEIGQVMGAVWQIVSSGSPAQRGAAVEVLVDTRRKLYGILADGEPEAELDAEADDEPGAGPDAGPDAGGPAAG